MSETGKQTETGQTGRIAISLLYIGKKHAGGKDQVALNLLQGLVENGQASNLLIICYDYLVPLVQAISPDLQIEPIPCRWNGSELNRLIGLTLDHTFAVPSILKRKHAGVVFHVSCTNGLRKMPVPSVMIPHDIKAVAHRKLASVKISWYKYCLYRIMYHMDFRHADRIIAIGESDKQEICRYYPQDAAKVVRIYNPIYMENDKRDTEEISWQGGADILAINLQFHHKNILTLIKAFEQIRERISGNLVLVGSIPARMRYLQQYVEDHQLQDRIRFTGFVTETQKEQLLAHCRLYVNCSLYEGFGMTAVEAMLAGVPVLLSDIPANREITQGRASYYRPAASVSALAQALLTCMETEPDRTCLLQNRQAMLEAYDYRKIAGQYEALFLQMMEVKEC